MTTYEVTSLSSSEGTSPAPGTAPAPGRDHLRADYSQPSPPAHHVRSAQALTPPTRFPCTVTSDAAAGPLHPTSSVALTTAGCGVIRTSNGSARSMLITPEPRRYQNPWNAAWEELTDTPTTGWPIVPCTATVPFVERTAPLLKTLRSSVCACTATMAQTSTRACLFITASTMSETEYHGIDYRFDDAHH